MEEISNENMFYEVYYAALNSIKIKPRSVYDVRQLLLKKEYPTDLIEKTIDKLLNQGYLSDLNFIKAFVYNQLATTNNGPYKIKSLLSVHNVSSEDIENELACFSEKEQLEKIEKLATRFYKSNRTRGGYILKNKITSDLINYGYSIDLIEGVLSKFNFSNDSDLAKKEYDKLYKKLSRKYSGDELKRQISIKMRMKGLRYEED